MSQKYSDFATRLIETRRKQGIRQIQLCRMASISRNALVHYELGERTPNADILKRIADALNVTTDYLIYGDKTDSTRNENDSLAEFLQMILSQAQQADSILNDKKTFIMNLLYDDSANGFINYLYDFLTFDKGTKEYPISLNGLPESMSEEEYEDFLLMKIQSALRELKKQQNKKDSHGKYYLLQNQNTIHIQMGKSDLSNVLSKLETLTPSYRELFDKALSSKQGKLNSQSTPND